MAQIDKTMPSFSMHLRDELPVYGRTVVVHLASDSAVKPACGVIGGAFGVTAAVAFTEQFPGYDGAYPSVRAAAHVTESDGTLTITAVMTGLGADMTGGWHIHSGFSCDDAGGHYFEGLPDDPWCSSCTTWTSDSTGVATVTWSSSDFSLTGVRPVSGRTFVVHDKDGKKAACGVIEPSTMQITSLGAYPGYTGGRMVGGLVGIADRSDGVQIEGLITGLEPGVTGGWHIHSGYSCSETPAGLTAGAVGGHYFDPDDPNGDPWTVLTTHPLGGTFYESDGSGVARISKAMPGFSLYGEWPVYGRTVVVHESNSAVKPACGVIGVGAASYEALMPSMVKYVDYTPGLTVNGMLKFSSVGSTLTVSGVLTGLEPSTSGGWHVHSGFSCTDTAGAGGHYYDGLGSDPWCSDCVKWYSDAKGVAVVSLTMEDFTLDPAGPRYVGGRTVVVHASAGTKVACGVIEPLAGAEVVMINSANDDGLPVGAPQYPGVAGVLLQRNRGLPVSGVVLSGLVTGLPSTTSVRWSVTPTYSCAADHDALLQPFPDTSPTQFGEGFGFRDVTTSGEGIAEIYLELAKTMTDRFGATIEFPHTFSLYGAGGTLPIYGKAVAFGPTPGRYACGANSVVALDVPVLSPMPHPPPFPPAMPSPPSPPPSPPAPPPPLIVDFDPELPYAIVEIAPFDDLYCSENPGGKCTVYGTLAVQSHVGGIYAYGYLSGLEKSVTAGWHVHEGYECDDIDMIKGHYFEKGSFDPWVDAKYTSDANGVAEVAQQVAGFTLTDAYPVAGRALVIHDQFRSDAGLRYHPAEQRRGGATRGLPGVHRRSRGARAARRRGRRGRAAHARHDRRPRAEPDGRLAHPLGVQLRRD